MNLSFISPRIYFLTTFLCLKSILFPIGYWPQYPWTWRGMTDRIDCRVRYRIHFSKYILISVEKLTLEGYEQNSWQNIKIFFQKNVKWQKNRRGKRETGMRKMGGKRAMSWELRAPAKWQMQILLNSGRWR